MSQRKVGERRNTLIRIEPFITRLRACKRDREAIKRLCAQEVRFLRTAPFRHQEGKVHEGYTDKTLRGVLTDYRKAVSKALGAAHPALDYLKPPSTVQTAVRDDYEEALADRHINLRPIDVEEHIQRAVLALADYQGGPKMQTAAAIMALTGRRPIETLKTGTFTRISDNEMLFDGQTKTRGAKNAQTAPYPIPVFGDAATIERAVAHLRRVYDLSALDNRAAKARYCKTLDERVAQMFSFANNKPLMPSDLRDVYAMIACKQRKPPHISDNAYISLILGHSALDISTSLSYITVYEIGHKREHLREMRQSIKALLARLEVLRENETLDAALSKIAADPEQAARIASRHGIDPKDKDYTMLVAAAYMNERHAQIDRDIERVKEAL